jgi:hypothetical protein
MSSRRNPARPANNVVTAMTVELQRQHKLGDLREVGLIDQQGHLFVSGTLDLAMLAHVTELALRGEFAALSGARGDRAPPVPLPPPGVPRITLAPRGLPARARLLAPIPNIADPIHWPIYGPIHGRIS